MATTPIPIPKIPVSKVVSASVTDPIVEVLKGLDITKSADNDKRLRTLIQPSKAEDIESRISDPIGEIYREFTDKSILSITAYMLMINGVLISVRFQGKHYSSSEFAVPVDLTAGLLAVIFRSFEENKPSYASRIVCNVEVEFKLNDDLLLEYQATYTPFVPDKQTVQKVKIFDPGLAEDL
jgi:hypothetical protein